MDRSTVIDEVEGQLRDMLIKHKKDTFDELAYWKEQLRNGIHGRETKMYLLREMTAAANRRGITVPPYNSEEFSDFLKQ